MPATAASVGVRNRFEPCENIRGGVAYLASLRSILGEDLRLVLAGAQCRPRAQVKALEVPARDRARVVRTWPIRPIQREAPFRGGSN